MGHDPAAVFPVADKDDGGSDALVLHQIIDCLDLVLGLKLSAQHVKVQAGGDGPCHRDHIPGQQHKLFDAVHTQVFQRVKGAPTHLVGHHDIAAVAVINRHMDCNAGVRRDGITDAVFLQKRGVADQNLAAADNGADAPAGDLMEPCGLGYALVQPSGGFTYGGRDRMA